MAYDDDTVEKIAKIVQKLIPKFCALFSGLSFRKPTVEDGRTYITLVYDRHDIIQVSISTAMDYRKLAHELLTTDLIKTGNALSVPGIHDLYGGIRIIHSIRSSFLRIQNPELREAFKPFGTKVRNLKASTAQKVKSSRKDAIRSEIRDMVTKFMNKYHLSKDEVHDLFLEQSELMPIRDVMES